MSALTTVYLSKAAEKQLARIPKYIVEALQYWVAAVEYKGISEVRKTPGYHDEPLKGQRLGQRSVRLNRAYRAIYTEKNEGLEILIIEVNKHEY